MNSPKSDCPRTVAVVGAGSWGTALANHLSKAGHQVCLWGRDAAALEHIQNERQNLRYFSDYTLHDGIAVEPDLELAGKDREVIVLAVPSSAYREICTKLKPVVSGETQVVSTAKGFEEDTLLRMTQVIRDELPGVAQAAALSGPSFAKEVLCGLPTAVTLAAAERSVAEDIAPVFHYDNMRIYASDDLVGVETGGAVKNVIALAAGIVDGAGMGDNARAALMTRGLAELQRLVVALGGQPLTVAGLSGLGDLLLTATGDLSRNRRVGLMLGKGSSVEEAVASVGQVVEGVVTAAKVKALGERCGVDLPITEQVNGVLSGRFSVPEAVKNLLSRRPKAEFS